MTGASCHQYLRRIRDVNLNYLDECVVAWDPQQALIMRITGTNLPIKSADIRFTLWPENGGTVVQVSPLYELKYGTLGRLLDAMYLHRKRHGSADLRR